jgi:hypothetical protein
MPCGSSGVTSLISSEDRAAGRYGDGWAFPPPRPGRKRHPVRARLGTHRRCDSALHSARLERLKLRAGPSGHLPEGDSDPDIVHFLGFQAPLFAGFRPLGGVRRASGIRSPVRASDARDRGHPVWAPMGQVPWHPGSIHHPLNGNVQYGSAPPGVPPAGAGSPRIGVPSPGGRVGEELPSRLDFR